MSILKFQAVLLGVLLAAGCGSDNANSTIDADTTYAIRGELSEVHIEELQQFPGNLKKVVVNSPGGKAGLGVQIGKFLHERDLPIYVVHECSSSCAEYILPGAKYVIVVGNPIIGFHGNAHLNAIAAREQGFELDETCKWKTLEWLEFIYEEKSLSYDFIELQREAIGLPEAEFHKLESGCLVFKSYQPSRILWRPSIDTLRAVWGLDVRSQVDY